MSSRHRKTPAFFAPMSCTIITRPCTSAPCRRWWWAAWQPSSPQLDTLSFDQQSRPCRCR
ncbi:MAG: hypothetical protein ACK55Z_15085 [bacterium]